MEVNSKAPAGPALTGFCYLLKNLGEEKQRGFVTNSQGRKLETVMYRDPQNKLSVEAWAGADSISKDRKPHFFVPLPFAIHFLSGCLVLTLLPEQCRNTGS